MARRWYKSYKKCISLNELLHRHLLIQHSVDFFELISKQLTMFECKFYENLIQEYRRKNLTNYEIIEMSTLITTIKSSRYVGQY